MSIILDDSWLQIVRPNYVKMFYVENLYKKKPKLKRIYSRYDSVGYGQNIVFDMDLSAWLNFSKIY